MTEKEAGERLAYWQKVLRLQDWDISIRLCSMHEMARSKEGQIDIYCKSKQADIRLLNWEGYAGSDLRPRNMEQVLVHELLHIFFDPFQSDGNSEQMIYEEQAVNLISEALVALDGASSERGN